MNGSPLVLLVPFLLPLLAGILCFFAWKKLAFQKTIYIITTSLTLGGSALVLVTVADHGIISLQTGNWDAPFGITLVVDMLGALMLCGSSLLAFLLFFFSLSHTSITQERKKFGFYPAILFMLFGIHGALITGDLFNLYVWFEVMLISSFVLLTLGGDEQQLEGAVKYVTLNFIASGLLLTGIGIVYGLFGSTNMAELSVKLHSGPVPDLSYVAFLFFVISFGIKSALFPLFFWLPASYHTPPIAISAIVAGLLTKVGMYAMFRTALFIFPTDSPAFRNLFLIIAGLTMLVGIMGAIAQHDYRKMLSYLIISHMGYMVMGIGIGTHLAIAGAAFYILHSILVKSNLFFIGGLAGKYSQTFRIDKSGGLYRKLPLLSCCFFISAMSLSGIPPLTGFWGKFVLAKAGIESENFLIVAVALLTGLLTLFAMGRVWLKVFLQPSVQEPAQLWSGEVPFIRKYRGMYLTVVALAGGILLISLFPNQWIEWSKTAATHLLDRQQYIDIVLQTP